ncbi:MAG: electron transfer flavoprotein subunit alpha/FixB family protein [Acidimicrobiales bacterium]
MTNVLVLAEHDADGLIDASLRAVSFAREVATSPADGTGGDSGGKVAVCVIGEPVATPGWQAIGQQAAEQGAVSAYVVPLGGYAPLAWARAVGQLADRLSADVVVAAGTDRGNEVMAHLGAIAGEEMVANCFLVARNSTHEWRLTRQRWGGSLVEEAWLEAGRALLTLATDAVPPAAVSEVSGVRLELEEFQPQLAEGDTSVVATESREQAGGVSLATARVVVSGGRGVGGVEGFSVIEQLAAYFGGAVGVSRAVTSLGWRPHSEQVGQTGTRVTPDLYLACGISGAIQHLAGCQSAKTMIAVNTDGDAPIMTRADYAVIGDVNEVLPALLEALRARSSRA